MLMISVNNFNLNTLSLLQSLHGLMTVCMRTDSSQLCFPCVSSLFCTNSLCKAGGGVLGHRLPYSDKANQGSSLNL